MAFDIEMIQAVYAKFPERIHKARQLVGKPLTLAEKILYAHLWDEANGKMISFRELKNQLANEQLKAA